MSNEKTIISTCMANHVLERVKKVSDAQGLTRSEFIRQAILDYLAIQETKAKAAASL